LRVSDIAGVAPATYGWTRWRRPNRTQHSSRGSAPLHPSAATSDESGTVIPRRAPWPRCAAGD
jgi:hypothetical protein